MLPITAKGSSIVAVAVLVLVASGSVMIPVSVARSGDVHRNFVAHLSAAAGVTTRGEGEAIFHLSKDGTTLSYKLIVSNINNVFMAHIHFVSSGNIVVWLFPSSTVDTTCLSNPSACEVQGRSDGVLVQGTITAADFTGELTGMTMSDLMAQITSGNTFVNVHTIQNPGGEIQGVIH
jgi:hypothetical protein